MATTIASTSLSARQGYAPARVSARAGAKPAVATRAPLRVVAGESRIGKHPVPVPKGVTYTLKDNHLAVKVRNALRRALRRLSRLVSSANEPSRGATPSCARPGPMPAIDRVLGFWLENIISPRYPHLFILQGPKGELEFTFPPTMVMTEGRLRASSSPRMSTPARLSGRRRPSFPPPEPDLPPRFSPNRLRVRSS